MSDAPGRGYLPPSAPAPAPSSHRRPWVVNSSVGQTSFCSSVTTPPQQPQEILIKTSYGAHGGSPSNYPQTEGIDLTSKSGISNESTINGRNEPINGQLKETTPNVSVIATNPLLRNETSNDSNHTHLEKKSVPAPIQPEPNTVTISDSANANAPNEGVKKTEMVGKLESKRTASEAQGTPSHPVETKISSRPMASHTTPPEPSIAPTAKGLPSGPTQGIASVDPIGEQPSKLASIDTKEDKVRPPSSSVPTTQSTQSPQQAPDHVESLLENMFQVGSYGSNKQSVIVSNNKAPILTEDKVVAILEDVQDDKSNKLPSETVKTEPEVKNEFMEVESALEKMFAGIVEPSKEEGADSVPGTISNSVVKSEHSGRNSDEDRKNSKIGKKRNRVGVKLGRPRKSTDSNHDGSSLSKKNRKGRPSEFSGGYNSNSNRAGKKNKRESNLPRDSSIDSSNISGTRRGPFIHIEGSRDAPSYLSIVNNGTRDEEERDRIHEKAISRRKHADGILNRVGLYSSTLSVKYNSQNVDTTWICIFCQLRPHCESGLGGEPAGDLFGPYMVKISAEDSSFSDDPRVPKDTDVMAEQKRRGSGKQVSLRSIGAADQFVKEFSKKNKKLSTGGSNHQEPNFVDEREIWVHEKCAVWAPGVILVGPHLLGLAEAVAASIVTKCSSCTNFGAGLGCVVRNCPMRSHYGCAISNSWNLDHYNFIATCPKHSSSK